MKAEKMYELLLDLNEDNYENMVVVDTKEELVKNMIEYFDNQDLFSIYVDEDDFTDEDGEFDEEKYEKEVYEEKKFHIEEHLLEWSGKGAYCLVGGNWGENRILKVDECLECELENIQNFPIEVTIDFFNNTKEYIKEWKKDMDVKYMYLINWVNVTGEPYYKIEYVVESNKQMSDTELLEYLYEERGIFVGEFNQLGCSYFVEEIEEFDTDLFTRYNTRDDYELIIID